MQADPPLLVKHFGWSATAKTKHHPSDLALTYWARATLKPAQMELLHARVEQERFALTKLESMVWAATQGFAFITPPQLDVMTAGAMIALMKGWTDGRAYPLNYAEIIRQAIVDTFQAFNNEVAACEAYQAHVDPDNHGWGLRVEITPLTPSAAMIEP